MFETVRDYCRRLMQEANEVGELQNRHAIFYAQLGKRLERQRNAMSTQAWKNAVQDDIQNFRAALEWSVLRSGDLVVGTELAVALATWWAETSHFTEGRFWIDHIIWRMHDGKAGADLHRYLFAAAGIIGSRQAGANLTNVYRSDVTAQAV